MSHEQSMAIAATIAAVMLLAIFLPAKAGFAAKPLLTENEIEFYGRLKKALPDFAIFPQVALRAFVKPAASAGSKRYWRESGLLGAKHCDFLICDPNTLKIVTIIELDDRTHNATKDASRDAMTRAAGYPTLRFQSRSKPEVSEIRKTVCSLTG